MTTRGLRAIAVGLALALAAPAMAGDAQDTVTEKKAQVKKKARAAKPGRHTMKDRANDAKDSMKAGVAKTKKQARKAGRKVRHRVHQATK